VTYGIKVFDKEVVLFKSFYTKLMVLESFSLFVNYSHITFPKREKTLLVDQRQQQIRCATKGPGT